MKKIVSIFLNFILLLSISLSLYIPKTEAAFSCSVSPSSVATTTSPFTFTIDSGGNLANGKYYVSFGSAKIGANRASIGTLFTASGGKITVTRSSGVSAGTWDIGVYAQSASGTNLCQNARIVATTPSTGGTGYCNINFTNTDTEFTPTNDIKFYTTGDIAKDSAMHHYLLHSGGSGGPVVKEGCDTGPNLSSSTNPTNLGQYSSDTYYLEVRKECNLGGLFESTACYSNFSIGTTGGGPTSSGPGSTPGTAPIPAPPCDSSITASGGCTRVSTAFGPLGTNSASLIKALFGYILSAAGAIAVLLIIYSGYRLMVSQGNPEQVQQAREQLTAAVVGLLFIIFSLVILQFIGLDILGLPGFRN